MKAVFGFMLLILALAGVVLLVRLIGPISFKPAGFFDQLSGQPQVIYEEDRTGYPAVSFGAVIAGGWSLDAPAGQISVVNNGNQPINVTHWLIKANRGSYMIGKAIEIYDPSGLTAAGEIFLSPGGTLYIYSHPGPINFGFQVNKCLGYLQNTNNFDPPLPQICPTFSGQEIAQLSGVCQSYLLSLSSCLPPEINIPLWNDWRCAEKLNQLNYKSCFDRHRSDPDFLTGEWRLYGSGQVLDPLHDQVQLIDEKGRVVDQYNY